MNNLYESGLTAKSLPLRKCGLKRAKTGSSVYRIAVTSLAEVWIETHEPVSDERCFVSLPLRKCGLKLLTPHHGLLRHVVTSLAEVWIETENDEVELAREIKSLPLRKCGLKLQTPCKSLPGFLSLSLRKCGLKHFYSVPEGCRCRHFPCGSVD